MARQKFAHSFARFRLEQGEYKIYHDGERILTPINSNFRDTDERWNYGDFITRFRKGFPFLPDSEKKAVVMRSYDEFSQKTGLMISSRRPTLQRFYGQKVEYYLTSYGISKRDIGEIPRWHRVEADLNRGRARLVGGNSLGNWFYYKRSNVGGKGYWGRKGFMHEKRQSYGDLLKHFINVEKKQIDEFVEINEIVVGVDIESHKLVTIPRESFNPKIFICGKTRQGKTTLHYRLMDNIYHKWKKRCVDIIDINGEAPEHCLEWKTAPKFHSNLMNLELIGETTRSLPIVYLTPSTSTLGDIHLSDEVGFKITLPFEELIFDIENIFRGNKSLGFEATSIYFNAMLFDDNGNKMMDGLPKCENITQMGNFITNFLEQNQKKFGIKHPEGTTSRMINVLKYLLNLKVLNITEKTDSKWIVQSQHEQKKYPPYIACLIGDLIPAFNTKNLRDFEQIYTHYLRYILNDLHRYQTQDKTFLQNESELFYFLNEVSSMVYDELTRKFTVASDFLDRIIREAGGNREGIVFGTQDLDQVSEFARTQSNYIFSFNQNSKNADILVKDFDALEVLKSDLKKLQPFECIGFPSTSPFHLYDEYGKLDVVKDTPVKMRIFPSLSAHRPPIKAGG